MLRPEPLELHQDLDRDRVVGRLEDLDDVVAAERHIDADELAAGRLDDPLALLDPLAPRRQAGDALRRPTHQRDVVGHAATIPPCVSTRTSPAPESRPDGRRTS
jgi:hypothetical protein